MIFLHFCVPFYISKNRVVCLKKKALINYDFTFNKSFLLCMSH